MKRKRKRETPKPIGQLTLRVLLEHGLPNFEIRPGQTQSAHTSGHSPIVREITNQALNPIFGMADHLRETCDMLDVPSSTLLHIYNRKPFFCSSETDIQTLVSHILNDILELLQLSEDLHLQQETYAPRAKYLGTGGNKSDFWVIYGEDFQPILVVEVKSPHVPSVLLNPRVVGQIGDYMLDIASFYGQRDVFGITTTGNQWKFHWLAFSNDSALSQEPLQEDVQNIVLEESLPELTREVYSTNLINLDDPQLIPLLLSVVTKSFVSPKYKVPLISANRLYITLSENSWEWKRLEGNIEKFSRLTINVDRDIDDSSEYVVLNHLARTEQQLVWVAVAKKASQIVVIKQFTSENVDKAERERDMWMKVNRGHAFVRTVRDVPSVVMPLVFHVKFNAEGKLYLDCDLVNWLFPAAVAPDQLPNTLMVLRQQILAAAEPWKDDLARVAQTAIRGLAEQLVVHDDIAWRHFALMPQFTGKNVSQLTPVMIDFSLSHDVASSQMALEEMNPKLEELIRAL